MILRLDRCPQPRNFTPAGVVYEAHVSAEAPSFIRQKKRTGRRGLGVRYEAQAQEYLEARYGDKYRRSPWLRFFSDNGWRWCQPDGVLILPDEARVIVVEIKFSHTSDAWWQTQKLYTPVLKKLFNEEWQFDSCEVVRWYDPAVVFPVRTVLCEDISRVPVHEFGVHIYKATKGVI